MSSPFVAEIRMVGFYFAPKGWATCDGQLLPISQNTALFSLLGTFYGGDGKSTFALPDLKGSVPISQGSSPGLSDRFLGEMSGTQTVTLLTSEMPVHTHQASVNALSAGEDNDPGPKKSISNAIGDRMFNSPPDTQMSPFSTAIAGGSLPHNNLQPYLVVNFVIAMQGVFPPRP